MAGEKSSNNRLGKATKLLLTFLVGLIWGEQRVKITELQRLKKPVHSSREGRNSFPICTDPDLVARGNHSSFICFSHLLDFSVNLPH